ncbi:sulfur oxidation c-type cytochrome SoxA [Noviherbaspirillum galbum]|uniref:SoxAX cytochrome complex subunit A n=1 Tax=Noviherbaspirillum galbum TaxID=2709383 RepID=A0A6B3SRE3_9BURK|nr:sulfur oxidation c-type cytochrome SoxA [Noviherbaspirillum galbum]NEX63098.1 sulfur oxidation c-type cytochrome SoxA [Noviherbaspirillum galbum]
MANEVLPVALLASVLALAGVLAASPSLSAERRSGYEDMGPAIQAMQRDDAQNPATLWVKEGELMWGTRTGRAQRSCADCHGEAERGMKGVAARYPAFDPALGKPLTLAQRINQCRTQRQRAEALAPESDGMLQLESFVALQSRGMPIVQQDPRLQTHRDRGEALFRQRLGQLNLSCAQCHDERAGLRLGGTPIPQGHPNGYPLYRLEWQAVGSLGRRLRNCMTGVRAAPYAVDAPEMTDLEIFLKWRARGMAMESPAVRP